MGAPLGSLPELIPLEFCLLFCFEKLQIQLVFLGYLFDSLPWKVEVSTLEKVRYSHSNVCFRAFALNSPPKTMSEKELSPVKLFSSQISIRRIGFSLCSNNCFKMYYPEIFCHLSGQDSHIITNPKSCGVLLVRGVGGEWEREDRIGKDPRPHLI